MQDYPMPKAALWEMRALDYSYNFEDIFLVKEFNLATTTTTKPETHRPSEQTLGKNEC